MNVVRFAVLVAFGSSVLANEITVEPRSVPVGELVEITIRLEGSFASLSSIRLPLTNLEVEQGPSTSSEFRWVNGVASRSKMYRYIARAHRAGSAAVGPIDLLDRAGRRLHLDAVTIAVLPDNTPRSSDRGGLFVIVEADKTGAFLGEQVVLTWTLYSRQPLRGFRLTSVPVLENFWSEEIPQSRQDSEQVILGGEVMQKATVRRVALFPLRSGTLRIAPLGVLAEVIVPDDFFGGWGLFERRVEDRRVRSEALEIQVKPLPAEAGTVGHFELQCAPPVVPRTGPVAIDVTITGTGNLRAANPPVFEQPPAASVQIQARETTSARETQPIRMRRGWRYLLFPRGEGPLRIPSLRFDSFDPATAQKQALQCGESRVLVTTQNLAPARQTVQKQTPPAPQEQEDRRVSVPFVIGFAALAVSGAIWAGAVRRRAASPLLGDLLAHRSDPRTLRRALHESVVDAGFSVAELFRDESSVGESFRALHSLIDLMEKEPWEVETAEPELRRRAQDFARHLK